ncbi:MAG: 4-alpha-glucanotransferase [Puniceicoccales bacterium]|nr:4-alpha-glucanotransferase [Puniceicoccales bacterium]
MSRAASANPDPAAAPDAPPTPASPPVPLSSLPAPPPPEPPLFSGLRERAAGVFLHPTALPSDTGVGNIGAPARRFLEFAAGAGFTWWQVCPLGPTGYGDSPYQCFSSFAGNPYLVELEPLRDAGLLADADLAPLRRLSRERVEFGYLWEHHTRALDTAAEKFLAATGAAGSAKNAATGAAKIYGGARAFAAFRRENAAWLDDYALFTALKKHFAGTPWNKWDAAFRSAARARATLATTGTGGIAGTAAAITGTAAKTAVIQFFFDAQWHLLRDAARAAGVRLLGDLPIYVAPDSADVWANPELFQLDPATGAPRAIAGVPPDYFSPDGQLWGNPLYDWRAHARDHYRWWLRRLGANLARFDAVRLDHFRGFHDYWAVPMTPPVTPPVTPSSVTPPSAARGSWQPGPGLDFFRAVRRELGDAALVAEDLGDMSAGVHALRRAAGLPGMAVLQFAFGGDASNPYLPHNHRRDTVIYAGTHDNDTTAGWYATAAERERDAFRRYFGADGAQPHWTLIHAAYASPAALAVVSLPDILGLGTEARFNTPGRAAGNWQWRLTEEQLATAAAFHAPNLRVLATLTGRYQPPPTNHRPLATDH